MKHADIEMDDLPLLTDIVSSENEFSEIPTLTEIVVTENSAPAAPTLISEADMQRLLEHFSANLETVLSDKISHYMEDLHRQAVKLAVLELKSELPELLRKSFEQHDTPSAD